jgi:hypothetical protein
VGETYIAVCEYARRTRQSTYTLALVVPFLAIYEVGLVALRLTHGDFHARNGADAMIRFVLFPLGVQRAGTVGAFAWSLASILVLVVCYLVWRSREPGREPVQKRYVAWLYAESAGWALVLFLGSLAFFSGALRTDTERAAAEGGRPSVASELVFNAGAGVYEELVFRVLLVLVLAMVFTRIMHVEKPMGAVAAAVAAAVVFSLMHFGARPGADPWGGDGFMALFVFRLAAGLFFSLLFCFRSFGVAVAAHALYDNMVTVSGVLR